MHTLRELYNWYKKQNKKKIEYFNTHILFCKPDGIEFFQCIRNEKLAFIKFDDIDNNIISIGNFHKDKSILWNKTNPDINIASNEFRNLFENTRGYEIQMLILNLK